MHNYDEDRTEQCNGVCSVKSEAELALDVLYYWSYNTHEALRGLFATAELVVLFICVPFADRRRWPVAIEH